MAYLLLPVALLIGLVWLVINVNPVGLYRFWIMHRFMEKMERDGVKSVSLFDPNIRMPRLLRRQISLLAAGDYDQEEYDLFISYRSESVDNARILTDRIISSGISTWFAEYKLLLLNNKVFSQRVEDGMRRSTTCLFLVSDGFFESDYCMHELDFALSGSGPSTERLFFVCGREPYFEQIVGRGVPEENIVLIENFDFYDKQVLEKATKFIEKALGNQIHGRVIKKLKGKREVFSRFGGHTFSTFLEGWVPDSPRRDHKDGRFYRTVWFRKNEREGILTLGVVIGYADDSVEKSFDDWTKRLEYLNRFAFFFFPAMNQVCRGVHLFRSLDREQVGYTYLRSPPWWFRRWIPGTWARKYVIHYRPKGDVRVIEIVLDFFYHGAQFPQFCDSTSVMNRFIAEIRAEKDW